MAKNTSAATISKLASYVSAADKLAATEAELTAVIDAADNFAEGAVEAEIRAFIPGLVRKVNWYRSRVSNPRFIQKARLAAEAREALAAVAPVVEEVTPEPVADPVADEPISVDTNVADEVTAILETV